MSEAKLDVVIWQGTNSEGDDVTLWKSESGDYPVMFDNEGEGHGGATIIPKEALDTANYAQAERIKALEEGINEAIMQVLGLHNRPDCWDEANTNKLLDTLQKLESRALLEKP